MDLSQVLEYEVFGNTVKIYVISLLVFILSLALLKLFKGIIVKKLKKLSKKTKNKIDDLIISMIETLNWFFYISVSAYISLQFVNISDNAMKWINYIFMAIIIFFIVRAIMKIVNFSADRLAKKDDSNQSIIRFLVTLTKGIIWLFAILLILSNMGYNITSLVAGLGIGGIAVALALQNILSDIFSSVSIYFDKPFKVGDFIIVGDNLGVVKKIGIKTTRLESLWGQEVVISNQELTSVRINNYKKMERRRIHFKFGVTYQTPVAKLKRINEIIKDIFDKIELADLDRVHFKEFGDFSLNYEVAYYVNTNDYNKYMDVQQEINISLKERFEKEKIEFAYPTQSIFLNKSK